MLGDLLSSALSSVGVTPEAVEQFLGRPCGCRERQEKLNQLTYWAKRILKGKTADAGRYLAAIIGTNERDGL